MEELITVIPDMILKANLVLYSKSYRLTVSYNDLVVTNQQVKPHYLSISPENIELILFECDDIDREWRGLNLSYREQFPSEFGYGHDSIKSVTDV